MVILLAERPPREPSGSLGCTVRTAPKKIKAWMQVL
jgi:hypothetical protein